MARKSLTITDVLKQPGAQEALNLLHLNPRDRATVEDLLVAFPYLSDEREPIHREIENRTLRRFPEQTPQHGGPYREGQLKPFPESLHCSGNRGLDSAASGGGASVQGSMHIRARTPGVLVRTKALSRTELSCAVFVTPRVGQSWVEDQELRASR